MDAENGNGRMKALPILVALPADAHNPEFSVQARWHTNTGILCAPREVKWSKLTPQNVVKLFIDLVQAGFVGVAVPIEGNDEMMMIQDFPAMNLVLREPPQAPSQDEAAPEQRIILP